MFEVRGPSTECFVAVPIFCTCQTDFRFGSDYRVRALRSLWPETVFFFVLYRHLPVHDL